MGLDAPRLLQFAIAGVLLRFGPAVALFDSFAAGVNWVILQADEGTKFIFGSVADPGGPWGFVFAVKVLPVIIFFASLTAVLYHWRIRSDGGGSITDSKATDSG